MLIRPLTAIALFFGLAVSSHAQTCEVASDAQYRVEFNATWSAATLPNSFPPNPHFSGLVGGAHSADVSFWEPGGIASLGIERMAETGNKSFLIIEVQDAIANGTALETISGSNISLSPGFTSDTFNVNLENPLATIVTMIAPSPDWFVGTHGYNLFVDGNWVEEATTELFAYDSGTDSGANYTSSDADISPHIPIVLLDTPMFMHQGELVPFGTFRFVRLTDSCLDNDGDNVDDAVDNCTLIANADQRDTDGDGYGNSCDPDLNNDNIVNFTDISMWTPAFNTVNNGDEDFNGDGVANFADFALFPDFFLNPPGPSATDQ